MRTILYIFLGFLAAISTHAEINAGYTAEWLSHQSSLIANATPIDVENIKGPGEVWFTRARFRLNEVIKGPLSKDDNVTIFDFSYNKFDVLGLNEAQKTKKELLLFATIAEQMFRQIDGKYVLTETRHFKSAYYLDKSIEKLFTPEFNCITTFDELLKRTRIQTKQEASLKQRYWKGSISRKSLEVPFDTEAHRDLYAGSSCYLWLPAYKKEKENSNN